MENHLSSPPIQCCILIPSYNTGKILQKTILDLLRFEIPIWIIIDGSTDGSDLFLNHIQAPHLTVVRHSRNQGKGAAVVTGMKEALKNQFTHALVMDSDGQHPPEFILPFIKALEENPHALILGKPLFGKEAPKIRQWGHQIANYWVRLETAPHRIEDSLFGFRIYPLQDSLEILLRTNRGTGYDLETELAVRLVWEGYRPINIPVPVRYLKPTEGGISHFRYFRDNILLIRCHLRLLAEKIGNHKSLRKA